LPLDFGPDRWPEPHRSDPDRNEADRSGPHRLTLT